MFVLSDLYEHASLAGVGGVGPQVGHGHGPGVGPLPHTNLFSLHVNC